MPPDDQNNAYDPFASEKYVSPTLAAWAKQAAGKDVETFGPMVRDTATLLPRLFDATQQSNAQTFGPGPPTMTTDELPFSQRDPLPGVAAETAMNVVGGAGIVPAEANSLRTGIGLQARGKHLESYPQFRRLEEKGNTPEMNRSVTGWYRGGDNKPRYWLSDKESKLKDTATETVSWNDTQGNTRSYQKVKIPPDAKLGDIWDHPELYDAYPWLKNIPVKINGEPGEGVYKYREGEIHVGNGTPKEVDDTLHHEVVHAIQHYEGFAWGGGSKQFRPEGFDDLFKEYRTKLDTLNNRVELVTGIPPGDAFRIANMPIDQLNHNQNLLISWTKLKENGLLEPLQAMKKAATEINNISQEAYKRYLHLHGESEARDAPYIKAHPDKVSPWKIPLHVNPELEAGRDIQITAPPPWTKGLMGAGAAGTAGASMIPSTSKADTGQMPQNPTDKKPDQGKPSSGDMSQMSPGVMKWMMEFLKANPDLAKEMSTRMQAVINGKQIQGQQQGPGKPPQAMPQGQPAMPMAPPQMPQGQ